MPLPKDVRRSDAAIAAVSKRPRRRLVVGVAVAALAGAAVLAAFLLTRTDGSVPTVVPNSLVKIDPETHEIVDVFRVGGLPFKPAIVGDYVFVASEEDGILSRIDVRSGELDTFGGLTSPAGVAAGADGTLWVGSWEGTQVRQIDADDYHLRRLIELREGSGPWVVAVGEGSVWVAHGDPSAVSRFSARTGKLQGRCLHRFPFTNRSRVRRGGGLDGCGRGGRRVAADRCLGARFGTDRGRRDSVRVGRRVRSRLAVGFRRSTAPGGQVRGGAGSPGRFCYGGLGGRDPGRTPTVWGGDRGGSVWVANGGETTISEIDPRTNQVVNTIATRYYPEALVYGHGFLWVSLHAEPFTF